MASEVISMEQPFEAAPPERVLLSSGRYVYFGPFRIDQQRQEVSRNGSRLKLQGKVYQTLLILLEKSGEVVTREELRGRLWPADTHVNYDANVNTTVNKLRQALGDSSDKPVYVETIPRKGYCLLVQPAVSNLPGNALHSLAEKSAEHGNLSAQPLAPKLSRSDLWIVLGAIGLILAGMFLGAGIMRLWIGNHAASGPGNALVVTFFQLLGKVIL